MLLKNVKKHGISNISYTGDLGDTRVVVIFEEGVNPVEGDIEVTNGKIITRGPMNYYYIKGYSEVEK